MTKKEQIYKFLEKNCIISIDEIPSILNNLDIKKKYSPYSYLGFINKIFPNHFFNTEEHFFNWYDSKISTIENDIDDFYNNYNLKKGLDSLIHDCTKFIQSKNIIYIDEKYITTKMTKKLLENVIEKDIDSIQAKKPMSTLYNLIQRVLKKYKITHDKSIFMINDYIRKLYVHLYLPNKIKLYMSGIDEIMEYPKLLKKCLLRFKQDKKIYESILTKLVTKIYFDFYLTFKFNDFLSQLVITLGSRNWVVTWVGHGPLTHEKMYKYMKATDEKMQSVISLEYKKWYEDAIINASEKLIFRNDYGYNSQF